MSGKGIHAWVGSAALLAALCMGGCSTEAKRVDCDGTLKPINKPAASTAPKPSAARDKTGAHEE